MVADHQGGGHQGPVIENAGPAEKHVSKKHQVVIVGGGPVGLAMAVELGQRDVSVALIERHVTPQQIPKGQNLTNRTLEHFYFWNCVDELRAASDRFRGRVQAASDLAASEGFEWDSLGPDAQLQYYARARLSTG